jgi:hypothetical protein
MVVVIEGRPLSSSRMVMHTVGWVVQPTSMQATALASGLAHMTVCAGCGRQCAESRINATQRSPNDAAKTTTTAKINSMNRVAEIRRRAVSTIDRMQGMRPVADARSFPPRKVMARQPILDQ